MDSKFGENRRLIDVLPSPLVALTRSFIDITQMKKDLAAVTQDGFALEHVKEQTPEICLAAVQQNGCALEHVKEQTPEICLAAVTQDGFALEHVKEQTPEICLAAVKENGRALEFADTKFLHLIK